MQGTYRVEASPAGYLALSHEFTVPAPACEEGGLNLTLHLIERPGPICDIGTSLDITVYDQYTGVPVPGVLVDVSYEMNISSIVAEGVRTDDLGQIQIPVSKLGQYVATLNPASIPPYLAATNTTNKTCC